MPRQLRSSEHRQTSKRFFLLALTPIFSTLLILFSSGADASPEAWRKEGWGRTDFSKTAIEWSEVLSGGPPRDGIPPIDSPVFRPAKSETQLSLVDPVIALEIDGEARAYPLRILMWHEIVNDTVGNVPVAVTYCPLCNAAIVFRRDLAGRTLTFGTSGKLRHSDLIMYDRQSESWWQQFTGEAIVGELTGQVLTIIPSRLESFSSFKTRHPDGRVLRPADPTSRDYGRNPYEGYDTSNVPFLYRGDLPSGINPMVRVVILRSGKSVLAVTLELLRKHRRITFSDHILTWSRGQASALDKAEISKGRDVGNVTARRRVGETLVDVPYDLTFAFVAHAFNPEVTILQHCPSGNAEHIHCGEEAGN